MKGTCGDHGRPTYFVQDLFGTLRLGYVPVSRCPYFLEAIGVRWNGIIRGHVGGFRDSLVVVC